MIGNGQQLQCRDSPLCAIFPVKRAECSRKCELLSMIESCGHEKRAIAWLLLLLHTS